MISLPQFVQNVEVDRDLPVDRHDLPHGLLEYRLDYAGEDVRVGRDRGLAFHRFSVGISKFNRALFTNELPFDRSFSYEWKLDVSLCARFT